MINNFIKQTIDMLFKSDIKIHIPSFNKVELNGEKRTLFLEVKEFVNQTKLEDNLIFCSMIFFTLIDTYIDIQYPYLEGDSFRKKYLKLPSTNDKEIIIREIYRILKIIRNATIHSRNSIELKDGNNLVVGYIRGINNKSTYFELSISKFGLELIYTLILLYLDQGKYCDAHQLGLLRTIYDDILSNISKISDDIDNKNLINLSSRIRLNRIQRYVILNPDYIIDSDKGIIEIHKSKFQDDAIDYIIQYEDNRYIIPDEILSEKGIIKITDMKEWILEKNGNESILFNL